MDLTRVMAAVGRHKLILAIGLLAGVALGFLSLYRLTPPGQAGPRVQERAASEYKAEATMIIDTPGFGIGRADVEGRRANEVAPVYVYLATSDPVMKMVTKTVGEPLGASLTAELVPESSVIKIVATGSDPVRLRRVLNVTAASFIKYLGDLQEKSGVPESQRMVVRYVNSPKLTKLQTRRSEMAILAFLLPLFGAVGMALAVESVRMERSTFPLDVPRTTPARPQEQAAQQPTVPPQSAQAPRPPVTQDFGQRG